MNKPVNAENEKIPFWPRLVDSIYIRCLVALAISTALTVGTVTYKSVNQSIGIAKETVLELGGKAVAQLADRTAPALRFRKADDIGTLLESTLDSMDGKASGALVVAADGEVLAERIVEGYPSDALHEAIAQVLATGSPYSIPEQLVIAYPVMQGPDAGMIGALALDWRTDTIYSAARQQNRESIVLASAIGLVMMLVVGWMLKRLVARPMHAIAGAMREIAGGRYDVDIPQYRRGNEIGIVARTLEEFRDKLAEGEAAKRDAQFRSAALEASSAGMMIADADFNIVYASPAVLQLLERHASEIIQRVPGFDPKKVVGRSIDQFHKQADMQRTMLSKLGDKSHTASLEMGEVTMVLDISKIDDASGTRIGYVVEWDEVTEQRLNAAVLESLDANQARAEFAKDGKLVYANDAFARLAGLDPADLSGSFGDLVFADGRPADPATAIFREFEVRTGEKNPSYVLAGLSPILDSTGNLKRTVLIGADVTEERRRQKTAEAERERLQSEQEAMISDLSNALSLLADGDLNIRISTAFAGANDRIRQDFNKAVERLEQAIASVINSATTIRAEVGSVTSASESLSKRTESQAATLEETAAAISEISASVSSSAEGARNANQVVSAAQENARSSGSVVRDAVSAMGKIEKSSTEISSIVKVIDDIAFQTNLLALNAGVEAARAGDAGRGFAVVASEVRALAQRSSDAANEISSLIATSSENVSLGVTLVGNAGDALESIIASISEISGYVSQIASASQEQSMTISEINSAMTQLDQVTQQNAAMFEETTAASQSLAEVARDLTEQVNRFTVSGSTSTSSSGRPENHENGEKTARQVA